MKKKIILITYDLHNSMYYRQELIDFFGNKIDIEPYTIVDGISDNLQADAVLALSPMNNDEIISHFTEIPPIIHGQKVISNYGYRKLMEIIPGSKVLLMTTNRTSAFEMAAYLYQLGINHIDFIPSYPENPQSYHVDIAVTPGQVRFIPHYINHVIDIGWRHISPDTLMSLMVALNIKTEELLEKLYIVSKDILSNDFSNAPLDLFSNAKELLDLTINLIDDGLLFMTTKNTPSFVNHAFLSMLDLLDIESNINNIFQYLPSELRELILDENERDNYIFKLEEQGQVFAFSKHAFSLYKNVKGYLIMLKDTKKIEHLEHEIRKRSIRKSDAAKYSFSDIIATSPAIKDCIKKAKRMALTNHPVLITGESGTGKELLAQSIHQYSARAQHPFIALNCASLSKDLLESELFGYEEGAFTGARRGGKKGLFELAQNGTIFLDEIGEMPVTLQAKLLRVLQENEIRRIGSGTTIPINVRIITATNRDLHQMMDEGLFRLDLFYRISMFSLEIPPLRERSEDILTIVQYVLKNSSSHHRISKELEELLLSYQWNGNVRELKNCIEYMTYMGDVLLTPNDLPPGYVKVLPEKFSGKANQKNQKLTVSESSASTIFPELFLRQQTLCITILNTLQNCPMGRNRLMKELGYEFTEHEMKKALSYLTEKQYVETKRGRTGTSLTQAGLYLLKKINEET